MRFGTRYDTWMVVVMAAIGLIFFSLPIVLYFPFKAQGIPIWLPLLFPAVFVLVNSISLPQYYELREEGLFIRQGWKKVLLSYPSIRELSIWNSGLSAPVLSTHRLVVTAAPCSQIVIAVREQERFLAEVERRSPQLERGPSGLNARGRSRVHS